jgi:uroporphyrinogen decarboxylase
MSLTQRELVIEAIEHREVGRVPYCINVTPAARAKLAEHYGREDVEVPMGNCMLHPPGPWWEWTNIPEDQQAPDEPSRLPEVRGFGSYTDFYETITRLRETTDAFLLVLYYGSLYEKVWSLRGMQNTLQDMLLRPDYCEAMFELTVQSDLKMLEMMIASDVDGILLGCDWGSQQALMMSPAMWHRYIGPRHARMFEFLREHNRYTFLHSCGNIRAVLPDVVEMGVQVLNPVQPECMDIRQLKAEFGDKLGFWGGISTQQTLPYGTPDGVRAETREVAKILGAGGGYILSPAQEVQGDVPLENLLALIETAQELLEGK